VTVTVRNRGAAGAHDVHVLISLSPNGRVPGRPTASLGSGCTGTTVLDCSVGSLGAGASTTLTLRVSATLGKKLSVGARAREAESDGNLADNAGTLTLRVRPRLRPFKLGARAARTVKNEQLVLITVTRSASVSAQAYVRGRAQPVRWRRSVSAGTRLVRVPLPKLGQGRRLVLVLRARNGTSRATVRLELHE
jgi:hypothetical protein